LVGLPNFQITTHDRGRSPAVFGETRARVRPSFRSCYLYNELTYITSSPGTFGYIITRGIDGKHLGMQPSSQAIRKQLKRVLAHTLFTNSKRYPVLLAYIVEQTLLGNGSQLKNAL
jgi:hypothetical protein